MRLTTKGRFAVTAMIDLALFVGDRPVTLASISERQSISLSYLEQLFAKLRRHKIVESVRGQGCACFAVHVHIAHHQHDACDAAHHDGV